MPGSANLDFLCLRRKGEHAQTRLRAAVRHVGTETWSDSSVCFYFSLYYFEAPVDDEDGDEDEDGQHRQRSSDHVADVKTFAFYSGKEKRDERVSEGFTPRVLFSSVRRCLERKLVPCGADTTLLWTQPSATPLFSVQLEEQRSVSKLAHKL